MDNTKIIIRIGYDSMSFSTVKSHGRKEIDTESYDLNSSISMAANLREAFSTAQLLQSQYGEALAMVDSPVLLVPMEELAEDHQSTLGTLYLHTFASVPSSDVIMSTEIDELSAVAVYTVNKDLKTVLDDHFPALTFSPMGLPVWREAYNRAFPPKGRKLFAFFHDSQVELFSFRQNRFAFHNTFSAAHAHDALYYILFAWKQLAMDTHYDQLEIIGEPTHGEWLIDHLRQHITNVTPTTSNL